VLPNDTLTFLVGNEGEVRKKLGDTVHGEAVIFRRMFCRYRNLI
jgi:hypothetical protein